MMFIAVGVGVGVLFMVAVAVGAFTILLRVDQDRTEWIAFEQRRLYATSSERVKLDAAIADRSTLERLLGRAPNSRHVSNKKGIEVSHIVLEGNK